MITYALYADIIVPERRAELFEERVREFQELGSFQRLDPGWDAYMISALRTPSPSEHIGNELFRTAIHPTLANDLKGPTRRYVNLFMMPDPSKLALADLMARSADDQLYTEINGLISLEFQSIATIVPFPRVPFDSNPNLRYSRVTRQFSTKKLGAYLFGIGALLPTLAELGWQNIGIFQNITGPLNTLNEFWIAPPGESQNGLRDPLDALKNNELYNILLADNLARAKVVEHLQPAPYFQNTQPSLQCA